MLKICDRLCLFPQYAIYVEDLRKIVLNSPMCNIWKGFAQDCTYFPQCAIYVHDLCKICARLYLFPQCVIYSQDLRKIVLISPNAQYMRNICARFAQDCADFPQCAIYAQHLCQIVVISPMCNIFTKFL